MGNAGPAGMGRTALRAASSPPLRPCEGERAAPLRVAAGSQQRGARHGPTAVSNSLHPGAERGEAKREKANVLLQKGLGIPFPTPKPSPVKLGRFGAGFRHLFFIFPCTGLGQGRSGRGCVAARKLQIRGEGHLRRCPRRARARAPGPRRPAERASSSEHPCEAERSGRRRRRRPAGAHPGGRCVSSGPGAGRARRADSRRRM